MPSQVSGTTTGFLKSFLAFLNSTGSPYHSTLQLELLLKEKHFIELLEKESWHGTVAHGGKYYIKRGGSSIAAFVVGSQFKLPLTTKGAHPSSTGAHVQSHDGAVRSGFVIAAGHTDSPCLRLRPNSAVFSGGYDLLGVECYGGGLWHTWFDRGLGMAGKVVVKTPTTNTTGTTTSGTTTSGTTTSGTTATGTTAICLQEKLVRISRPICIVPNLAIHLQSADERAAFRVNKEHHLRPLLGLSSPASMQQFDGDSEHAADSGHHHKSLLKAVANGAGCTVDEIIALDLCLMDATESRLCGIDNEFIESPRLDNLASCWAAFTALAGTPTTTAKDEEIMHSLSGRMAVGTEFNSEYIHVACAFDHEEVGSQSWTGADSSILESWLRRLTGALHSAAPTDHSAALHEEGFRRLMANSIFLSADQAHASHPNYLEKHQSQHRPKINAGVVLKFNGNQRYTTSAGSAGICRAMALQAVPPVNLQNFVVQNESPCGSTIGPMMASRLGLLAMDIGLPQFGMHSCRELGGTTDVEDMQRLLCSFYKHFHTGLLSDA